ncbi:hypothetical protein RHS03_08369, partial [Rhizoctonia solani]
MPPPSLLLTSQQHADLKALVKAYLSNTYHVSDELLHSEVTQICFPNKTLASAAWKWVTAILNSWEGSPWPKCPIKVDGPVTRGNLTRAVKDTRNMAYTPEPPNAKDNRDQPEYQGTPNRTLRLLSNGKYEGKSPEHPVNEERVLLFVEESLVTYINAEEKLPRTITNFRFVSAEDETQMVSVGLGPARDQKEPDVVLIGLVGSANLKWEMGQRLQAGLWWFDSETYYKRPVELVWMRIPVHRIETRKVDWWRNGNELVTVVWSSRGAYALQGADIPYVRRMAACFLHQNAPSYFQQTKLILYESAIHKAPKWINQNWLPDMVADYRKMMLFHPENTHEPSVPAISDNEAQRIKLEGGIASREWQIRDKREVHEYYRIFIRDQPTKPTPARLKAIEEAQTQRERLQLEIQGMSSELQGLKAQLAALLTEVVQDSPSSNNVPQPPLALGSHPGTKPTVLQTPASMDHLYFISPENAPGPSSHRAEDTAPGDRTGHTPSGQDLAGPMSQLDSSLPSPNPTAIDRITPPMEGGEFGYRIFDP